MAIELTADEVALLNVIKDIKASGYGEVIAVIQVRLTEQPRPR